LKQRLRVKPEAIAMNLPQLIWISARVCRSLGKSKSHAIKDAA